MNAGIRPFTLLLSICITLASSLPSFSQDANFSQQYTAITKKILLKGVELERFSLNYRREATKPPKFRTLRYLGAQEGAAGCLLAFEIGAMEQFNRGRQKLTDLNTNALSRSLTTAMTGSIIGASSSAFELSSNIVHAFIRHRHGFDSHTANRYVASHLKDIDELLAQRAALVAAHQNEPAYARAVAEGAVLQQMRNSFVNEYSKFNVDSNRFLALQNSFFLLNTAYNTMGAIGAGLGKRGLTHPEANGPSNILFLITGAVAGATPALSHACSKLAERHAENLLKKQIPTSTNFDPQAFAAACDEMKLASSDSQGSLIPSMPQTERFAMYSESSERFQKQLDNETKAVRRVDKIVLGNMIGGPAIGSLLMTQGILGTYGYYRFGTEPVPRLKKEFNQLYRGSVVGTIGAGMNVVGNAAFLLGTLAYEHKLAKNKLLPSQLIAERLNHLDEVEKLVNAL